MPDDEINPSADTPDSGGNDSPDYAPGHDDDTQHPRPGSGDDIVTPKQIEEQNKSINDALERMHQDEAARNDDHNQLVMDLQKLKEETDQQPPRPPEPMNVPAPPDQDQKNNITTLATGLLKWAALLGIGFGLSRKSSIRNSIFKIGLGSALQGYAEGSQYGRNKSLQLWEKNRQAIMDQNRAEQQQYKDLMADRKFTLQQKMDLFQKQAQMNRDVITWDAARRGDVAAVQNQIRYRDKMLKDFHTQMKQQQNEWYKILGLSGREGSLYREWIMGKGGPDIRKAKDENEEMDIESKYPIHQMLEENEERKREQGMEDKLELHKKEKEYDEKLKSGDSEGKYGSQDDPLGLNLGQ